MVDCLISISIKYIKIENMKTKTMMGIIILFFSLISFGGCSNDDDDFEFGTSTLKQTQWIGNLTESDNGKTNNANIGIVFYSVSDGKYSIKWDYNTETEESIFNYSIDGNFLIIEGWIDIQGSWLLIQSDKDTMILEKGTGATDAYKATLTLKRKV